eukprot:c40444_g1_i1 orf=3-155(-)
MHYNLPFNPLPKVAIALVYFNKNNETRNLCYADNTNSLRQGLLNEKRELNL